MNAPQARVYAAWWSAIATEVKLLHDELCRDMAPIEEVRAALELGNRLLERAAFYIKLSERLELER